MKAIVCNQPHQLELIEKEKPKPKQGNALCKVKRIGICGTDLHAYEGTQPYFTYPRILGHELALEVVKATNFNTGDYVTVIPYFNCGICVACKHNKGNCCTTISVFGVHADGGMQEFIEVPEQYLIDGKGLSLDELALVEPLAIGLHGLHRANVEANENLLIIGAGPIGMGMMALGKAKNANVIAMDVNENRLAFCKEKLGIAFTINAKAENIIAQLQAITNNEMPTTIIDATGNRAAINNALNYLAHGGTYVLVGLQKETIEFSHPEFHKRETTLMSSRNATRAEFEEAIQLIQTKQLNATTLITHRCNFENVPNDFESWLNPEVGIVKMMVEVK